MEQSKSGNLSIGDILSFVALIILSVAVFFGMNFMTLGDKISSAAVALLLLVLMLIFVYLAAHAKAQNWKRATWKKVEYAMVGLYVLALIPCCLLASKFFDVQFEKQKIIQLVQNDLNDINGLFADYTERCETRCNNYQTELEALLKHQEGRERIVRLLDSDKKPEELTQKDVNQACESLRDIFLNGRKYSALKADKDEFVQNCESNFKNWNILFLPQSVNELMEAKHKYAEGLEEIFEQPSPIEKEAPEWDTDSYVSESNVVEKFQSSVDISVLGIIAVLVLGILGLLKYLLGEKSSVVPFDDGDENVIRGDGGMVI